MENNDSSFAETHGLIFGDRLRELRNEKNISAREMSVALGQNVNYINLIENGKRLPSMQGFFSICDYLQISPGHFFQTKQNPVPQKISQKDILKTFSKLSAEQVEFILELINRFVSVR